MSEKHQRDMEKRDQKARLFMDLLFAIIQHVLAVFVIVSFVAMHILNVDMDGEFIFIAGNICSYYYLTHIRGRMTNGRAAKNGSEKDGGAAGRQGNPSE